MWLWLSSLTCWMVYLSRKPLNVPHSIWYISEMINSWNSSTFEFTWKKVETSDLSLYPPQVNFTKSRRKIGHYISQISVINEYYTLKLYEANWYNKRPGTQFGNSTFIKISGMITYCLGTHFLTVLCIMFLICKVEFSVTRLLW